MKPPEEILEVLRGNLRLYENLLEVVQFESEELRGGTPQPLAGQYPAKKDLLPRLAASLDVLAKTRAAWQATEPARRARLPEVSALVRQNQDLLMRIIVLDRENEQALLRQGLVPPRDLPSVNRQRPHFVTDLYRRQAGR
jgi:hypothetical protein